MPAAKKSQQAKFSMKMPDWFFDLNEEERREVVEKVSKKSENFHELTDKELMGLFVPPVRKRSWFRK